MKKVLCFIVMVVMVVPAQAGLWDGEGADNLWSTDDNWEGNTQPVGVDAVITYHLSAGGTNNPIIQAGVAAQAGTLLHGDLGSFDWGNGPVRLTMTGGSLSVNGDAQLGRVDFFNWTVNDPPGFTNVGLNEAIFDISDGTVNLGGAIFVGSGSSATVNQTGGAIDANAVLINAFDNGVADAFAQYNLDGGTLHVRNTNDFHMWQNTNFDFGGGVLTIVGDRTDVLGVFIADGRMTAFDGAGTVSAIYDASANLTTVVGVPEPAALSLIALGLGGLFLRRKR